MDEKVEITALGNAGFRIAAGPRILYIDAFHGSVPGVAGASLIQPADVDQADFLLVTHPHYDHFLADQVSEAALRTHAVVVGPSAVMQRLDKALPEGQRVEMEPEYRQGTAPPASVRRQWGDLAITAFRTFHTREHNSYLIEMPGLRCFHDGDNEQASRLDLAALGHLDVLMIAPWLGSHWAQFIRASRPDKWVLMHLTSEEYAQQDRGLFLKDLCDEVPEGLLVLHPGESCGVRQDVDRVQSR